MSRVESGKTYLEEEEASLLYIFYNLKNIIEEQIQEKHLKFYIEIAENGAEAFQKVAASKAGYYDLVHMDIQMPIMDGFLSKPINIDEVIQTLQSVFNS